jgi:hypothetical protein
VIGLALQVEPEVGFSCLARSEASAPWTVTIGIRATLVGTAIAGEQPLPVEPFFLCPRQLRLSGTGGTSRLGTSGYRLFLI